MKRLIFLSTILLPIAAFARTYDDSNLPYSDPPSDLPTAVAVSVLTEEGVLQGNPDGTFRSNDLLNRAEFMKISMKLAPALPREVDLTCFPDVPADAWYARPICLAKTMGVVSGNAVEGVDPDLWLFDPLRPVP